MNQPPDSFCAVACGPAGRARATAQRLDRRNALEVPSFSAARGQLRADALLDVELGASGGATGDAAAGGTGTHAAAEQKHVRDALWVPCRLAANRVTFTAGRVPAAKPNVAAAQCEQGNGEPGGAAARGQSSPGVLTTKLSSPTPKTSPGSAVITPLAGSPL